MPADHPAHSNQQVKIARGENIDQSLLGKLELSGPQYKPHELTSVATSVMNIPDDININYVAATESMVAGKDFPSRDRRDSELKRDIKPELKTITMDLRPYEENGKTHYGKVYTGDCKAEKYDVKI